VADSDREVGSVTLIREYYLAKSRNTLYVFRIFFNTSWPS